jgi:hypothetical protein
MILRTAMLAVLALLAAPAARAFEFTDAPHCRANEVPLGQPARFTATRSADRIEVVVLANFGCGTTAGRPKVRERGAEIVLSAETILPDYPTPACKCTRTLTYRFETRRLGPLKIRFLKDSLSEGEAEVP